jgi:transposase
MTDPIHSYIAIDVAKSTLQVQTPTNGWNVRYNDQELKGLISAFQALPNALVVFEATGGYERRLRSALIENQVAFHCLSPRQVRAFAVSEGTRAKTDPIDAQMILKFAQQKKLTACPLPDPANEALADLMDRRSQLSEQLAREKNRHQKASPSLRAMIQVMMDHIEEQIAWIDREIEKIMQANQRLAQSSKALQSVVGVGPITACTILAYLPEIFDVGRNQLVALAGIAPYNRDSGKKEGKRYIQGGRAKVRRCLYMAATTAAIHNPVIRPYVKGLTDRGKPFKCAIVAAMRKLLIHLQSILKKIDYEVA